MAKEQKEISFDGDELIKVDEESSVEDLMSAEDIFAADDVDYKTVFVKGWGKVRLASLSAGDLVKYHDSNEGPAKKTAGIRLVLLSVVDKEGKRIFKDADLEKFKGKNGTRIAALVDPVLELNRLIKKEDPKNASGEAATSASPTD